MCNRNDHMNVNRDIGVETGLSVFEVAECKRKW